MTPGQAAYEERNRWLAEHNVPDLAQGVPWSELAYGQKPMWEAVAQAAIDADRYRKVCEMAEHLGLPRPTKEWTRLYEATTRCIPTPGSGYSPAELLMSDEEES